MMKRFVSREVKLLIIPAAAILAIGLAAGVLLAVLIFQNLTSNTSKKLETIGGGPRPAETFGTTPEGSETFGSAPEPVQTIGPAPVAVPKQTKPASPAPAIETKVTISTDGCMVTATGTPGMKLVAGARNSAGTKGGESTYALAGNNLTVSAGSIQGFISFGKLYNSAGQLVASANATITAEQCDPATAP